MWFVNVLSRGEKINFFEYFGFEMYLLLLFALDIGIILVVILFDF